MPQQTRQPDTAPTAQRRVRKPRDKEGLLNRLVEEGVFETYRDILIFAAALGLFRDQREPFDQTSEPIPWSVFSGAGHEAVINMVAAVSSDDFNILSPERFDERLTAFEEYANGGLTIFQDLLSRSKRAALDLILDLIVDAEKGPEPEEAPEIESIARQLAW